MKLTPGVLGVENHLIETTFSFDYPKGKAIILLELCNIPPNNNIPSHLTLAQMKILAMKKSFVYNLVSLILYYLKQH